MAFETTASLVGSTEKYRLTPNVKKFTLRDNGFEETSSGNYQFIRPLDGSPENKQGIKLKIIVNKDFNEIRYEGGASSLSESSKTTFESEISDSELDAYMEHLMQTGQVEKEDCNKAEDGCR